MRHLTTFQQRLRILLATLLLCSPALQAEPAYWFRWQSKFNGNMTCKQISPGEGWQQHAGPFYDAQCRKLVPKHLLAKKTGS